MEPFQKKIQVHVPYFVLSLWEEQFPHLVVGFSARDAGEGMCHNYALHVPDDPKQVIENRYRLTDELQFPRDSYTCGEQVHGMKISKVERTDRGRGRESRELAFQDTDGLITGEEDVLLASYYADCVPLYFYAPDIDWIGVAHAGWKGTVGKIGPIMIEQLLQLGADSSKIQVAIGPSIGACCYEVDEHVLVPMREALQFKDLPETIAIPTREGHARLDLKEANAELLRKAGLLTEQIVKSNYCTCCSEEYFHSHRRDQEHAGRMVAFIGKRGRRS